MTEDAAGEITRMLGEIENGNDSAREQLIDLVYDELRALAAGLMKREQANHTLQPTALVNEAALRIMGDEFVADAPNRRYFYGAMLRAMRRVLVDHARMKKADRRGGADKPLPLDPLVHNLEEKHNINMLDLDEALTTLEALNKRQADIVMMRFLGGFEMQEIADHLQVSLSTVEKEWRMARAWLRRQLEESSS